MKSGSESTQQSLRKSPEEVAALLIRLFDERFGGPTSGRFRISRKYLRKLAGRRKLADKFLNAVAAEVFEFGFVLVDCESYSIVLSQKQFASYRRVTDAAANMILSQGNEKIGPQPETNKQNAGRDASEFDEKFVQRAPEIH